jgi:hypothetical protein
MLTPSRALKGGDFCNQRATFRPEKKINSSIGIPIVQNTAAATSPLSHSQTCDTFRAAARTARRTGHGTSSLVGLDVNSPVPHGFVAEHRSKTGPGRIQDGLGHRGLRHRLGADIATDDQLVFPHQPGGLLVQMVASGVDNLCMDRFRPALIAGALRLPQGPLVFSVVPKVLDFRPVRHRGQRLQPKVDTDFARATVFVRPDFDLKIEIPASPSVLSKTAAPNVAVDRAAVPEAIAALEVDHCVTIHLDSPGGSERHPAKRVLSAPMRTLAMQVAAADELPGDGLDGIAVQSEQGAAAGRQLDERPRCSAELAGTAPRSLSLFR